MTDAEIADLIDDGAECPSGKRYSKCIQGSCTECWVISIREQERKTFIAELNAIKFPCEYCQNMQCENCKKPQEYYAKIEEFIADKEKKKNE